MNKLGSLGIIVFVVLIGSFVFAMNSGVFKGWMFSSAWDGTSTLTCGGDQHMTISGRHIKMDSGPVFQVGGNCELTVEDSDIVAPSVVDAGGSAHVVLKGGNITAAQSAILSAGNAQVEIHGTKITGSIDKGGHGRITGLPDLDKQQAADDAQKVLDDKWGKSACEGLLECYRKANFLGQASAHVEGEVAPDGSIANVTITGSPGDPRDCLQATMQAKKLAAYDGKPGKLICEFAGTFGGGNVDVTIGGSLRR
ncbi:MAG: hypothetical protein JSS44_01655 [Proteobacteria bacterium]|nr:hypothetical protein [Pseudomonadota bacterium]MBS0462972.1 hypothetical protein [Pseudomonadota bacterium]MBS0463908.1 hypothetical protein [Pseudomonadota bacterium]